MSKELDFIKGIIARLEDDYQHYTMCEKDEVKAHLIKCDIEEYQALEQALIHKDKLEKFAEHYEKYRKKLNNLTLACKETNNYSHQLSNRLEKLEEVIEIISEKVMPLVSLIEPKDNLGDGYYVYDAELYLYKEISKEEYDLLKEILK